MYIPPAGAPPGGLPQHADRRLVSLSTTCLVLATLEILYALYKMAMNAVNLFGMQMVGGPSGPAGGPTDPTFELMMKHARVAAMVELGRMLPFIVASGFLIAVALRLRSGHPRALGAARTWAWCALAIVVLSVAIEAAVSIPMLQAMQKAMSQTAPGGAPPPALFGVGWQMFAVLSGAVGIIGGAVVMSIWPVALLIWTDKLKREGEAA